MATTVSTLPDDKDSLKEIIRSQALSLAEIKSYQTQKDQTYAEKDQTYAEKERQYLDRVKSLKDENAILSEQVRFFKASLYARKTEKLSAEELRQMFLFDEAEAVVDGIAPEDEESERLPLLPIHARRAAGRPFPSHYPV